MFEKDIIMRGFIFFLLSLLVTSCFATLFVCPAPNTIIDQSVSGCFTHKWTGQINDQQIYGYSHYAYTSDTGQLQGTSLSHDNNGSHIICSYQSRVGQDKGYALTNTANLGEHCQLTGGYVFTRTIYWHPTANSGDVAINAENCLGDGCHIHCD